MMIMGTFSSHSPSSNDNVVSLEDNDGFRSVFDDKYLDISDAEEDEMIDELRERITVLLYHIKLS